MSISYSQLRYYRTCPRQYEYACVKKLPKQISAGESFGASVHNTLKKWGELEMENGKFKMVNEQAVLFPEDKDTGSQELTANKLIALWHQSFIIEGYESRLEADYARQRGELLLTQFFNWWQQEPRQVLIIEKGFKVDVNSIALSAMKPPLSGGISLSGRFDRVEKTDEGVHVIDYKTTAPRSQAEVDADLQLSIYALAVEQELNKPCTKLTLLFLNEDEVTERATERTKGQLADACAQIKNIYQQIEQREFHPTPGREACRRCPYKNVCDVSAV